MTVFELNCIRDETIRYFKGFYRDEGSEIRFILNDDDHNQQTEGDIITFTTLNLDDTTMRIQNMYIHIDRYLGIGMPEALILKAKEIFGKQIISSTNSRKDGEEDSNECISKKAKQVWRRLVDRGLAYYDCKTDRYKTFPPQL